MLKELEKAVQDDLDKDFGDVPKLKADFYQRPASVAEQLLSVAESIKAIHREMDEMQTEMVRRLDTLRSKLGSRG